MKLTEGDKWTYSQMMAGNSQIHWFYCLNSTVANHYGSTTMCQVVI